MATGSGSSEVHSTSAVSMHVPSTLSSHISRLFRPKPLLYTQSRGRSELLTFGSCPEPLACEAARKLMPIACCTCDCPFAVLKDDDPGPACEACKKAKANSGICAMQVYQLIADLADKVVIVLLL